MLQQSAIIVISLNLKYNKTWNQTIFVSNDPTEITIIIYDENVLKQLKFKF